MARLTPSIAISEISNPGEQMFAEALIYQLPENVRVIHSFEWVKKSRGTLIEGECDFVILYPGKGLLFVEVKGGFLEHDPHTNGWFRILRNGVREQINRDPIEQVRGNMYEIVKRLTQNMNLSELPFTYGYAVAFPNGNFFGNLPANVERELIFDRSAIKHLDQSVSRAFRLFERTFSKPMSQQQMREAHNALLPRYQILPVLSDEVDDQERALHRATEEQHLALEFLSNQKKAAIDGSAGTGKTLLALAKAQQMAAAGQRTLLLCYNQALAAWLQRKTTDQFGDLLTVQHYHGLMYQLCKTAGIKIHRPELASNDSKRISEFYEVDAAERLMDACDILPISEKFDAVIVDEGQDIRELWWHSLDSVFRLDGSKRCFYVFFDPRQNLYIDGQLPLPEELGNPYPLSKNCRNTKNIAKFCAAIIDDNASSLENLPEGTKPKLDKAETTVQGFQAAEKIIRSLTHPKEGNLKPSQIALLAPTRSMSHWPSRFKKLAITRDVNEWRSGKGILMHKIHSFKGLESDAIVLLSAPMKKDDDHQRAVNYMACSRAKHILHVIEVDELSIAESKSR